MKIVLFFLLLIEGIGIGKREGSEYRRGVFFEISDRYIILGRKIRKLFFFYYWYNIKFIRFLKEE